MKLIQFILLALPISLFAQQMNNDKLEEIYTSLSDTIEGNSGRWQFKIKEVLMVSITDANKIIECELFRLLLNLKA